MFKTIRRIAFLVLATVAFVSPSTGNAQSGGATLQGTISDSGGAAIPGAQIQITAASTGVSRSATSNGAGIYTAPNLAAGRYKVSVKVEGFASKNLEDVLLSVGAVRELDVAMTVAATDTVITVNASSNQVNAADTSVGGLVDGKQTRDLPLNGRDWTTLATLNTGVSQVLTQFAGAATATTRLSRGLGAQLTIGGNRPQQNSYRLDGININDYANGGPGSVSGATLGVDAVQEFNVITSDAPAQFGRMSGGVINSITRQGASQFHGSVYDFIRNSVFDSRGFFDPVGAGEPSFRRNQFGAALGGPIFKEKTFFFFNYEGFRQAQGVTIRSTVLSPNARKGLVTCTTGSKCIGGLQQLAVDPKVAPFLTLFPLPSSTVSGNTGFYSFQTTQKTNEDFSTGHLDHNFSQKDSLHGTALYDTASLDSADQTNTLYDEAISRRTTAALEEIHIFSGNLTNSARLGYNRSVAIAPNQKFVINPAVNDPALAYYPGRSTGQLQVATLTTVQGGSGSVGTNAFHYNSYQLYDDATYVIRKHTLTFGGAIEYDQNNTLGGVLPNGEWNFTSINNFLTNVPSFFEGGLPRTPVIPHDLRQTIYAAYVQDSWKWFSNLTVNMGLRYEMATNTTESAGRLGTLPTPTSPAAVSVPTFFTNNPTTKNFEPRLGIAWDPYHNGRTVISAASGIYDILPLNYTFQLQVISSAPSYQEGRVGYVGTAGKGLFPTTPFFTTTPKLRAIYTPPTPPRTYVIQSNINVQQQLTPNTILQIGYIGSHGVHQIFSTNDINNVAPLGRDPNGNYYWPDVAKVTGGARAALVLNPAVGTESDTVYAGSSLYHSMQTSLSYSSPHGFTGKIAYTWSHSIDDSSSSVSGASFGNSISGLPVFDMRLNRADSDFDVRNVFSANGVAPLPNIKRGGAYTSVLRGWTLNNIFTIRSGIPFTPIVGGDQLGLLGSQPYQFPNRTVSGRSCTNGHTVNYLDTTCFSAPGTYTYGPGLNGPLLGTGRRNTIDGPGYFFWTTGLMKDQAITDRVHAQFQVQAFNVSNHTNFANPAQAQTQVFSSNGALSGTAGTLTAAASPGRQLQFALKLLF
ncbi:MAG: carboxypeptidase regulatory-like domain-containing protein [Acidobacteriota bacterium]|nr:carboxypeptidase regulatory-like domain-containing protein [Acidobacteriota bacterium]